MRRSALSILIFALGCGGSPAPAPEAARETTSARTPAHAPERPGTPAEGVEVGGDFLPPMPTAVTSFGAARDDTHLYVLGGYAGTPHQYSREQQSGRLSRLPLDGRGDWEALGELEGGLQGFPLVAHDGKVCRFGGNRIMNAAGEPADMRSIDEAACFDVESRRWTALPPLPEGRSSHEAAMIGSTVYLAGGWRLAGEAGSGEFHDTMLALDLANPTEWRSIDAPFTRRALGVAAAGDRLVVLGGIEGRDVSARVDVYDPESGEWSRGPDFPSDAPHAAFGLAAVGVGDAVYASGREGVIHRWRPGESTWTAVGSLAFGRFFHQLIGRGDGELLAIGGIGSMHTAGRTRIVEVVGVGAGEPRVATLAMRFPGASRNRQGLALDGEVLYLFGGNNSLGQHDFAPTNFVSEGWRLQLATLRFMEAPAFPEDRQTMQVVQAGERLVSVGGFGHDGTHAVSFGDAYLFEDGRWAPRGGLPRSRTQFGLAEHEGTLWVFGGLNYDPTREGEAAFDHVTDILTAPLDSDAPFTELEGVTLPGPRRAFAGAVHDGRYYMFGGMQEGFRVVEDCFSFELASRTFEEIACPAHPRVSGELVAMDGKLYLGVGSTRTEEGLAPDRSVEVFEPASGEWSQVLPEIPLDTGHVRMLRHRNRLMFLSTHHEEGRLEVAFVDPRANGS